MADPARPLPTVESLIRDHHVALYRYAFRLTGSTADAEDLCQQTFLTACRKLEQVRDPEHVVAWLYAVLRSCFLKSCRKVQPQQAGALELNLDQFPEEAAVPAAIDRDQLQLALDQLPPEYKIVVVMFYFEHASYKQIAERLGFPIGTVMSRLARAKQRLRAELSGERAISTTDTNGRSVAVRLAERNAAAAKLVGNDAARTPRNG
ncbi:MAG TPA: RNA polymerase sigma factor [Pirellulaceae bacterium]|nr:RNA polymerase sigma factor [Pirellulaceae bacterium]